MTTMRVEGGALVVRFTTGEKVLGLVRDLRIPVSAVASVAAVDDGLAAAHGLRAPGLGLPGLRKLGTWRGRAGKTLVSVRRHQPAVRVHLTGETFATLLVGSDDAAALAAELGALVGR
jgi:hypothetical protein